MCEQQDSEQQESGWRLDGDYDWEEGEDLLILETRENREQFVITYGWGVPRPLEEFRQVLSAEQYNKLLCYGRIIVW